MFVLIYFDELEQFSEPDVFWIADWIRYFIKMASEM